MYIYKLNTIKIITDDYDIAEDQIAIGDQSLADQTLPDGDPSYVFEPPEDCDLEKSPAYKGSAAYREWEDSFVYFLGRLMLPEACALKNCPAVLIKAFCIIMRLNLKRNYYYFDETNI
jgi:hypothetical protein